MSLYRYDITTGRVLLNDLLSSDRCLLHLISGDELLNFNCTTMMERRVRVLTVLCWFVMLSALQVAAQRNNKRLMPWMCLERCGDDDNKIGEQLKEIFVHRHELTAVSFELYNLAAQGQLVVNEFADVGPIIKAMGLETFPMISSFPYPPEFIDWMRYVFKNPLPFIDQVIRELKKRGFTGINVDWEPTVAGTAQDARDYANFLTTFANALHKENLKVGVDVATWNPVWNYTLLSLSSVDRIHLMATYTGNWNSWQTAFKKALQEINIAKLGIGLETVNNANSSKPFTPEQMQQRFQMIMQHNIVEVDIWRTPIPADWWQFIDKWLRGSA